MTDEKAIEKMVYDQQQGWPLCPRCGEKMQRKVLDELIRCFDNVSVEDAAQMKF